MQTRSITSDAQLEIEVPESLAIIVGGVERARIAADGTATVAGMVDGSSGNVTKNIFTVDVAGASPDVAGLFSVKVGGQTFNSVFDPMIGWGYNWNNQSPPPVSGEPGFFWQIEANYNDGSARKIETYCAYQVGSSQSRPVFVHVDNDAQRIVSVSFTAQKLAFNYDSGSFASTELFEISVAGGATSTQAVLTNANATSGSMFQIKAAAGSYNARLVLTTGTNTSEIRTAGGSGQSLQIACASGGEVDVGPSAFSAPELRLKANQIGFYNSTPASKQTVTGSRGANAALASLLTALATMGLITDSSSA